ncbi:MAG: threonyl-tRNA synthetase [Patescibacteria group bacterium]|nr:threonine--tRNA ligase [Candidatus Saccharibacteria bacterium]MDQ5963686.1 threonyl-tRNA synthetase [Patescibacteria group bacterium]
MNENELYAMRHSLAHITAQAVQHLWPEAKFGVGPVVEHGFYYDIDLGEAKITDKDFKRIEKEMRGIINKDYAFERSEKSVDEALNWARETGQPYKEELLNDLKRAGTTIAKDLDADTLGVAAEGEAAIESVSFYTDGDFTDLCRGPHVESTGKVGAFKLMRVAGAYWRGKESNPQMQRLYGVAFATKEELEQHLLILEEAKKRDHRKLGQELDLFVFSDLVGAGLPLFTPRGTVLKNELDRFVQDLRDEVGFEQVSIPHITKKDLYEKSGHWSKFKDELFRITTREGHEFAMKPMNCPHHTQLYASRARSYRDLPIKYRDSTMVYRDEQSGELGGLSRVRGITQDDAHVFCRTSQVKAVAIELWSVIERFYTGAGFDDLRVRLSTHDSENMDGYAGGLERWSSSVEQLEDIIHSKVGKEYFVGVGEAAFYGPKIDFMAKDAIGRELQVATIQLDFNQPEGFDLTCTNEAGEDERIVMMHCAVMGSHERFLSAYIEHTAGRFPVWCAPDQVRILSVNQEPSTLEYVENLRQQGKKLGLRITADNSNDSVGKKIRKAEVMKVPYTLVVGEKEIAENTLTPRIRGDLGSNTNNQSYPAETFLQTVQIEAKERAPKSKFGE